MPTRILSDQIESYCRRNHVSPEQFGKRAIGKPSLVADIAFGYVFTEAEGRLIQATLSCPFSAKTGPTRSQARNASKIYRMLGNRLAA